MAKRVGKTDDQPFVKLFRELTYRWTPWEVWQDFVTMYACAISNAVDKSHFEKREELYLKRISKAGNSLTEPMCSDDSLENYWFTPMYCSDVWTIRRLLKGGTLL